MDKYSTEEIKASIRNTWGYETPDDVISFLADLFHVSDDSVVEWLLDS